MATQVSIGKFLQTITDDIAGEFPQELQNARSEFMEIIEQLDGDYSAIFADDAFRDAMQSTIDLFNDWMQEHDVIIEEEEHPEVNYKEETEEHYTEDEAPSTYETGTEVEFDNQRETDGTEKDAEKNKTKSPLLPSMKKIIQESRRKYMKNQPLKQLQKGWKLAKTNKHTADATMLAIPNLNPEQRIIVEKIRKAIPGGLSDEKVTNYFPSIRKFCYYIADRAEYKVGKYRMKWGWYTVYNVYQKMRDYDTMRHERQLKL